MDYKKRESLIKLADAVISVTLLILSYVLLIVPPWRYNLPGLILVFISALCFAIGYFRTIALIPTPKTKTGWFLISTVIVLMGLAMQIYGYTYMYTHATERSICINIVFMIESLAMFILAFDSNNTTHMNILIIVCRIASVLLIAFAIWLVIRDHFSNGSIYVATCLIVECMAVAGVSFSSLSLPWKKDDEESNGKSKKKNRKKSKNK